MCNKSNRNKKLNAIARVVICHHKFNKHLYMVHVEYAVVHLLYFAKWEYNGLALAIGENYNARIVRNTYAIQL